MKVVFVAGRITSHAIARIGGLLRQREARARRGAQGSNFEACEHAMLAA
jgi:hypothetical protein